MKRLLLAAATALLVVAAAPSAHAQMCPAGYRWNAWSRSCVAASACPSGYRFDGMRCVRLASSCGYGWNWNGYRCVRICPSHTYWRAGRCVSRHVRSPRYDTRTYGSRHGARGGLIVADAAAASPYTFRLMINSVHRARFSSSKLAIISAYARSSYFSSYQVRRLLYALRFSSDRIRALRALAPRIVDRHNAATLPSVFRFGTDRRRAHAILGQF